jgi:hypothetical protein
MKEQEKAGSSPAEPGAGAGTDVGEEAIAARAYEISLGEDAGTPEENWQRAEQELRERTGEASGWVSEVRPPVT